MLTIVFMIPKDKKHSTSLSVRLNRYLAATKLAFSTVKGGTVHLTPAPTHRSVYYSVARLYIALVNKYKMVLPIT